MGVLAAAVCPLAEAALMAAAGVWHYPRADLFLLGGPGVTSWWPPPPPSLPPRGRSWPVEMWRVDCFLGRRGQLPRGL